MATDFDVYLPFNGTAVNEIQWQDMFASWLRDFICAGVQQELQVYGDSTGRQVKVRTGQLAIGGEYGKTTSEKTLAVAANVSGNPRIDRVVARLVYASRKIELDVLTGTPAVSPSAPGLTQNTTVRELSLAQVGSLASGYTTIAANQVTPERLLWSPYSTASADTVVARDLWIPLPTVGMTVVTKNDGQVYRKDLDVAWNATRSKRNSKGYTPAGNEDTGTNNTWPAGLTRSVDVPAWATVARLQAKIPEAFALNATTNTQVDCRIGNLVADAQRYRWTTDLSRHLIVLLGDADVTAIAGTTVTLRTVGNNLSGTGILRVDNEASCLLECEFR